MHKKNIISLLKNEALKSILNQAVLNNNMSAAQVVFAENIISAKKNRGALPIRRNVTVENSLPLKPQVKTAAEEKQIPVHQIQRDLNTASVQGALSRIKTEVENCTACALSKTRIQTVFGEGTNNIPLVCIGEAPGEEEDKSGKPFVGRAGQLLTKMLSAINVNREDIFICNVLKCRPPMNRDPNNDEVKSCSGYLDRQLEILQPRYILALGRIAAKRLLNLDYTMAQFRTQLHEYRGIPVLVTYHPSALLRNPGWKQPAWEDLQKLQKLLGI